MVNVNAISSALSLLGGNTASAGTTSPALPPDPTTTDTGAKVVQSTKTSTNADGSTTTVTTYADGSTSSSTSPGDTVSFSSQSQSDDLSQS